MDSLSSLIQNRQTIKPPAYPWQDLALEIIKELGIPNNKRSAVFKVCKENSEAVIRRALNDTKELCKTGLAWRYFFKIIDQEKKK